MYIIVNHNGEYLKFNGRGEAQWTRWRWLAYIFEHYVNAVEAVHTYGGDIINAQG